MSLSSEPAGARNMATASGQERGTRQEKTVKDPCPPRKSRRDDGSACQPGGRPALRHSPRASDENPERPEREPEPKPGARPPAPPPGGTKAEQAAEV